MMASEMPVTSMLNAVCLFPSGARCTTNGEAMDQKIACAVAAPNRASSNRLKLVAIAESRWLTTKRATTHSSTVLKFNLPTASISGKT